MNPDYLIALEHVHFLKIIPGGVLLKIDDERCEIIFLNDDLIKIRISQGGQFEEKPSEACISPQTPLKKVKIEETKNSITLKSSALKIAVNKKPFSITVYRQDGSKILAPHKDKPFYQYQNNHFVVNRECAANDHIYGLGEKTGSLDRHGKNLSLWNKDVLAPDPDLSIADLLKQRGKNPLDTDFDPYYISIPFFYRMNPKTFAASGHFIDNPFMGNFSFNNNKYHSHISIHFNGGQYCEYIFAGPKIKDILENYTALSGRISRPPLWSLGYHQCRWKKYSQNELLELAQNQRNSQVPCDVLWLDIDYMNGYRVFTWNDELFPNREKLFNQLKDMGFRIITIVDPGIKFEKGYKIFDEAQKQNLLCKCENGQIYVGQVWPGKTAFPDFSQTKCRTWWGKKNGELLKQGIAGIWNDMNEPATGNIEQQPMRFAGDDNKSYPHERFHNEYALLMAKGTVEGLQNAAPNLRTFVLSRAGSAGIQRYAANWMGDNASRWDHLQMSLPMAMGLGLSGQPFVGADIGGFVQPSNPELFIRWLQYGAFTPFCRNHNDDAVDQYVWSFGEGVRKICEKFIKLRYQLLPYIYSQFVLSSQTGAPVQRPLVYDFQDDTTCRQIDDQYLFGENILVAPILQAGATSRQLYLPKGEWFHFETKQFFNGQQWISISAPIDSLPWFIRAGSIIPMYKNAAQSTMNLSGFSLSLVCPIPENNGTYQSKLIEDDGLTLDFTKGIEQVTDFTLIKENNNLKFSATQKGKWLTKSDKIELVCFSQNHLKWQIKNKFIEEKILEVKTLKNWQLQGEIF